MRRAAFFVALLVSLRLMLSQGPMEDLGFLRTLSQSAGDAMTNWTIQQTGKRCSNRQQNTLRDFIPLGTRRASYITNGKKRKKDKAKEQVKSSKARENLTIIKDFAENPQKDKAKEPPEGFYFLEE